MAIIKAIETRYDGYRFRSRLEARWAVFFNNLGLRYEYELEGYELESGDRYLPDFYLPELAVHLEAKPHKDLSTKELRKILGFGCDGNKPLLLAVGSPAPDALYLIDRRTMPPYEELESEEPEKTTAVFWQLLEDYGAVTFGELPLEAAGWRVLYRSQSPNTEYALSGAFLAARQARFEHGENPR